jgi:predicted NBD/HSP70 family sugar kinase
MRTEQVQQLNKTDWEMIDQIRAYGKATRGDLVEATGMSWATISTTISQLGKKNLVIGDNGKNQRRGGTITVNPDTGLFLGISIEESSLRPAVMDFDFKQFPLQVNQVPTGKDLSDFIKNARALLFACLEEISPKSLLGIGFSYPGFVNRPNGVLLQSPIVPEITGVPINEVLDSEQRAKLDGAPLVVESDIHCVTLAEKLVGERKSGMRLADPLVCVMTDDYLRAGLAIGDEVYRGANGKAGWLEIERLSVEDDKKFGQYLGKTLAPALSLLNPEMTVLYGWRNENFDQWDLDFRFALKDALQFQSRISLDLGASRLYPDSAAIGAALMAYQSLRSRSSSKTWKK